MRSSQGQHARLRRLEDKAGEAVHFSFALPEDAPAEDRKLLERLKRNHPPPPGARVIPVLLASLDDLNL